MTSVSLWSLEELQWTGTRDLCSTASSRHTLTRSACLSTPTSHETFQSHRNPVQRGTDTTREPMSLPHRQQRSASTRHTTEIQSGRFAVSLRCTSVADSLHRSNRRCVFGMTFPASFQTTFVSTHVRYVFNAECPTPSIFQRHTIVVPTYTTSTMKLST